MILLYTAVLLYVVGTGGGQPLFKLSRAALSDLSKEIPWKAVVALASALLFYDIATPAWVWVVTQLKWIRVYPMMILGSTMVSLRKTLPYGTLFTTQNLRSVGIMMSVKGVQ